VTDDNPFRAAAKRTWLAAEQPDLAEEERERLLRQGAWHEEEAARWDLRHGVVPVPAPRASDEALPRRVPGVSWAALSGESWRRHPP
jgi:hypothetical protein